MDEETNKLLKELLDINKGMLSDIYRELREIKVRITELNK